MLNVGNISKNVEMLKNVDTINFLTQIIFFFDKEFQKIIINPKFYQHLFSALLIRMAIISLYVNVKTPFHPFSHYCRAIIHYNLKP